MSTEPSGGRSRDWATIPNAITLLRLALVVPIVILLVGHGDPVLTVVLLVLFGGSDWIDGHLARRLGQTSRTGAMFDPISDRIGVVAIVVALVIAGHLQMWVALAVGVIDIALTALYLSVRPAQPPQVTRLGKIRTAVMMTGIALVGFGLLPGAGAVATAGQVICAVGAVIHVVVGVGYMRTILRSPRR
ncbi:CDP-alcohol phosphatidyltransferase family protein [Microbacterium sp. MEC084]|uniref:CDP-alcohol phosphatidyltransferase family protein n=1 Tax=Microbacterium sp. MEC084 TaxID=1963027 RepID=UPI00106F4B99|nr:CDP-alcohol phosphatidyltransferase family protein [Microbacterium sp. MEC084]MCD1267914.1 CDP-alcohol phosphatidyltransferase family protein [Microbacterium sp. MEC084]